MAVAAPVGAWEHRIDAVSGEVLSVRDRRITKAPQPLPIFADYSGPVWSRAQATQEWKAAAAASKNTTTVNLATVDGTARVFDADPRTYLANASLVDGSPASAFNAAYVIRTLRDITEIGGVYYLEGPWVRIVDWDLPNTAPSTTLNGQWTAPRGNNAFNDAMTYFHIDQNQARGRE